MLGKTFTLAGTNSLFWLGRLRVSLEEIQEDYRAGLCLIFWIRSASEFTSMQVTTFTLAGSLFWLVSTDAPFMHVTGRCRYKVRGWSGLERAVVY